MQRLLEPDSKFFFLKKAKVKNGPMFSVFMYKEMIMSNVYKQHIFLTNMLSRYESFYISNIILVSMKTMVYGY